MYDKGRMKRSQLRLIVSVCPRAGADRSLLKNVKPKSQNSNFKNQGL
jgi:hypothetical protein